MANWYSIKAAADGDGQQPPTICIYDEIGYWGVTAKDFADDLKALGPVTALTVRINSGGGEFFAGLAIGNLLRTHPAKVTVKIDGLAGSIASVIAMAGDTVEMPSNAMMMVHNVSWWASGTAEDLRETAEVMDQMRKSLVAAYRSKTGLDDAKLDELLTDSGTWMTAAEAKELGFCDVVTDAVDATNFARVDPARFAKVPTAIAAKLAPPPPAPPPDAADPAKPAEARQIADLCAKAGFPELTAGLLTGTATAADVTRRIEDARKVQDACTRFRRPDMARNLIAAVATGLTVDAACAIANEAAADRDESVVTDTSRPNGQPQANGWGSAVAKLKK
ncbi:ATP-dependent protease ClpP protease subunit [Azospirillum baldaniorum]|uniref:head maturation protease, ClpP-related n=1 Tax=Azospirillum baldaniorum TaxID=1064539 RepID=UPI0011A20341|nr:head maturation protease, ClpP-related [Azospirillum baldaniorum]TWA69727.1 ATP-dependent protease ClpP protease subunit [Azospirillum baldaniorum]